MTTENEEWKPRNRYNDYSQEDGQNRMKRPYQSYNRPNYGNQTGGYNNRQENSYNRQTGGNYDRPRSNYSSQNNYGRNDYGNRDNNYERRDNGYNQRNQRSYDNNYSQRSYESHSYDRPYDNRQSDYNDAGSPVKKRRPRVGEAPAPVRNTNYNPNRQQGGGYNNYRDQRGGYQQQRPQQRPFAAHPNGGGGKSFNKGPYAANSRPTIRINKQNKYREENFDPNELIRLNKYLANAGICSRREADEFIQAGLVKVNGETVNELGTKVKRADEVIFHNEQVKLEQKVYVLLNKPKNCVTTADDPQERLTVMDLVKTACHERIFPVGRLDRNTTGVLLLTNDGDLASKLTHPKFLKKKIYHVWLDKDVTVTDMQKMAEGVELDDGEIHADAISYVTEMDKDQVGVEIHSGRNRVVRRMFEALGYHVIRLDRVYFAGLTKKNLKRGQWRYLNDKEVSMLRMGAFD
ncbi:MAG: RNA-binding S4 domain-containing protein [Dysgonamonadaceae bacterium]|jgi:23S rRNA pseudouridine2605 synthase|nr:RNA-binding S4 domain-containing protein [Dysgonamonadaceae bacterium]